MAEAIQLDRRPSKPAARLESDRIGSDLRGSHGACLLHSAAAPAAAAPAALPLLPVSPTNNGAEPDLRATNEPPLPGRLLGLETKFPARSVMNSLRRPPARPIQFLSARSLINVAAAAAKTRLSSSEEHTQSDHRR